MRNVPQDAVARVRKLVENGRRYRRLEDEYSRLVTDASMSSALKKLRRLILPRPRLVSVAALVEGLERMSAKERRAELPQFDRKLRMAASKGWTTVRFPYRRTKDEKLDVFAAFGVRRNMTPGASETVSRLGVGLGSFGEASEVLAMLACGRVSESKVRSETLAVGEDALAGQRNPGKDVRDYTDAQLRTPEDARRVPRTLAVMADGTNPPCTKADTQGVRGKDGGDAKSRQLRVVRACAYANVTAKGPPSPSGGRSRTRSQTRASANSRASYANTPSRAVPERSRGSNASPTEKERSRRPCATPCPSRSSPTTSLVARRCKQTGMHWRHHNAACVCALIAKIRSAA